MYICSVKRKIHIYLKATVLLLFLIAMALYIMNNAFFLHSHITKDGFVITHAHPFDKTDKEPYKSHKHSKAELLFLQQFVLFLMVAVAAFGFLQLYQKRHFIRFNCICERFNYYWRRKNRAPPSLMYKYF